MLSWKVKRKQQQQQVQGLAAVLGNPPGYLVVV
jgi:hypothetical protein